MSSNFIERNLTKTWDKQMDEINYKLMKLVKSGSKKKVCLNVGYLHP